METFTKIVFFVCGVFYLGTTTVLAKTPAGEQFLFISSTTCRFDGNCDYCRNITLTSGSNNGNSNGYGYGYTNAGNSPAPVPAPPVGILGNCTSLGPYQDICMFCTVTSNFGNTCGIGYCACAASAFNSEDCGTACTPTYKLDVSQFGSC